MTLYDLILYCGDVNDLMLQVPKLDSPIQALVLQAKSKFISVFERCIVVTSIYIKTSWMATAVSGDSGKIGSGTDTLSYASDQKVSWD